VSNPLTAFVVIVDAEGSPSLVMDIPSEVLELERQPTMRDVRRALLDLSADLAAQAAAQYVLSSMPKEDAPAEKVAKAVAKRKREPDVR
jgi:hypothetical protein